MRRSILALAFAGALPLAGAGCATTPILVVKGGAPVAGAEVFANGNFVGTTNSAGRLSIPQVAAGTTLAARERLYERPGYRSNHGPENGGKGWTERVYLTSVDVHDDGALTLHAVTAPAAEQDLTINPDNTLVGLHFLASLDWDASQPELDDVATRLRQSVDYMYNASDGQIVFEQIELYDNGTFLGDAEYDWNADLTQWPHTNDLGGYFGRTWYGAQTTVFMSRRSDQGLGTFQVIDHEFGHLGLGLHDEYQGFWVPDSGNYCSNKFNSGDALFGSGMPRASCVMNSEWGGTKFCTGHADNPHRSLLLQGGPCWDNIVSTLQDDQSPRRWTIKTPVSRNAIPAALPSNPWGPRLAVTNNGLANLCEPFTLNIVHDSDGQPATGQDVTLVLAGSGTNIKQGKTDSAGSILISGAHLGDRLEFNGNWTVSGCTITH